MNWNKGSTGMKMKKYIKRLMDIFPNSFINSLNELILYSSTNLYFGLDDVNGEQDIKCKLLEWCSRDAYKTQPFNNHEQNLYYQEMIRKRINYYLKTDFSIEQMEQIYQKLGNKINHDLTIKFVESGYDMNVLKNEAKE